MNSNGITLHGRGCDCGPCLGEVEANRYLVFDNGGDFAELPFPDRVGDVIHVIDQHGNRYDLIMIAKKEG